MGSFFVFAKSINKDLLLSDISDHSYELDCVWINNMIALEQTSSVGNIHKLFHYTSKENKEKIVGDRQS